MDNSVRIESIKKGIGKCVGKHVIIRANKGRKKVVTRKGVIEGVYPCVFMVKYSSEDDITTRVTYSYIDVLIENVQIKLARE